VNQPAERYDGLTARELAAELGVPQLALFSRVGSTLDVAHVLGDGGAPSGTLVLADEQTAGRGRQGRAWVSEPGAGIWLTLVERPADAAAVGVLSLRLGLAAAAALDALAAEPVQVKWPNDLYVGGAKLAGILVEARWREGALDWLAVGFGINVQVPRGVPAASLRSGVTRVQALRQIVPALRAASAERGTLRRDELDRFATRDFARGRRCVEPAIGRVAGIDAAGALLVESEAGVQVVRAGSLVLAEEA
jgi:BirA family biotin operon repressor/biotin-[acetyl-CoA-carboxylase] ligase